MTKGIRSLRSGASTSDSSPAGNGTAVRGISPRGSTSMETTDGPTMKVETDRIKRLDNDFQISPGSAAPESSRPSRSYDHKALPREPPSLRGFGHHRRDLAVLSTDQSGRSTSNQRNHPPAALPPPGNIRWPPGYSSITMPSSAFEGSFFNDSPEFVSPESPSRAGHLPDTPRAPLNVSPEGPQFHDERRPSVASERTISSQGSGRSAPSVGFHKKLQGFFGDDFPGQHSPHASATNLAPHDSGDARSSHSIQRDRHAGFKGSLSDARPTSPSSRPRTPAPSSEVTPWLFQDSEDISVYGDAPVRKAPAGRDRQRYTTEAERAFQSNGSSSTASQHTHRIHLPGHRHQRSKENSKPVFKDPSNGYALRPTTSRENSSTSVKGIGNYLPSASSSTSRLGTQPSSPTPSLNGTHSHSSMPSQRSPVATTAKRSLFDKITKRARHKEDPEANLKHPAVSAKAIQEPWNKGPKGLNIDAVPSSNPKLKDRTLSANELTAHTLKELGLNPEQIQSRKAKPHLGHVRGKGGKRGSGSDAAAGREANGERNGSVVNESLFDLDTDLSRMEGIISNPPPMTPPDGGIFTGAAPPEDVGLTDEQMFFAGGAADWNAPDSWAVKKVDDENIARLREIDEDGVPPQDVDSGVPYAVRIFRVDHTFATLSTNLNSTVDELLRQLGKKSFLQDDLENYQIVMRKHDLQRVLGSGERPIAIQRRLMEQAGYTETDRLDEVGREDNSYLCRFTFVPSKLGGYYSLEKDPGFGKMQKFSHVDLQGRNLITIPITLYQKATEIISLNLSRNLSLDIPKDFIQGCINLREIKFTSNEAWKLPPSLALASRLVYLDISNNRLEHLQHADLDKLHGLLSLKMANNKITAIPSFFGQFKCLRNLNLSSNFLDCFPDFLCNITSLVDLDISFNAITSLPDKIGQLVALERLLASNNKLKGPLPDSFSALSSLRELDIRHNGITSMDAVAKLPRLEQCMAGHNSISVFEGSFARIRTLHLNHNPVTRFEIENYIPTLTTLTLANAKLAQLREDLFEKLPNLEKLILDKNHFVSLTSQIGKLRKLEHLSLAKNLLSSLPAEIGCLQSLHFLDVRENNLKKLPPEIWYALRLDTLNVSSNVLEKFPKPGANAPVVPGDSVDGNVNGAFGSLTTTPALSSSPSFEELGKLEHVGTRRPSQASGNLLAVGNAPVSGQRKGSMVSVYGPGGRKASVVSRTVADNVVAPPVVRKDSSFSNRLATTFAGSLRHLYLADNRLTDEVFDEVTMLPELRTLNLSYNELYEVPQHSLTRWPHLSELYLSGNELTSLPSEDFQSQSQLKLLHINGNKFQVLPAELGKIDKLSVLDVGSNALKYNVSNWPYDWNWNYNANLKYLNLSGNKKLEIKPSQSYNNRENKDLTSFTSLNHLRVLGLMDVTLMVPSIPDQTEDRRIRTSGSLAGSMSYGMADSLGRNEHLSTIDMVVPKFGGHEAETLLGMFDGQALSSGGSKVARFLHENFGYHLTEEMSRLHGSETPEDALRRTFLSLNKDLATSATQTMEGAPRHLLAHRGSVSTPVLTQDDLNSGAVATVMFLHGMELYVANVGDAQAVLIQSEGGHKIITRKHDPAEPRERQRIRDAGGYVSRNGRLNDLLDVSRAFGYVQLMPAVMAAPHVTQISLKEQDEMVLIGSKELWDYLTPDVVVDIARSERGDLMRAAQKLRDLAMAFGASGKIMVIILGVSDLKKRERNRFRAQNLSMGPSGMPEDQYLPLNKRGKRKQDDIDDSGLSRLDQEIEAPEGDISMVFTDIKNSTLLWETYPLSMRAAIKMHNQVMRRQLRIVGGYEVKTEGDAFVVSFPTATSALLWCFAVQSNLLEVEWPSEVLQSVHGQEVLDTDGNVIFRGLSVRMGIHCGRPVCEIDPVTRRMDYFGPMVNRTARISSVADGGQITVSLDFMSEIQRALETNQESDRANSISSEDALPDDVLGQAVRRELRLLTSQGFEVKEMGERRLKGLENPEYIYLVYPHLLAGRLAAQQQRIEELPSNAGEPTTLSKESDLAIDTESVWQLWSLTLRLEMLCSSLEDADSDQVKAPETALLEKMKSRGGEVTDRFLLNFVEHQVSRVETCSATLYTRHMDRHFGSVNSLLELARPMGEVHASLQARMQTADELAAKEAKLRAIAKELGVKYSDL